MKTRRWLMNGFQSSVAVCLLLGCSTNNHGLKAPPDGGQQGPDVGLPTDVAKNDGPGGAGGGASGTGGGVGNGGAIGKGGSAGTGGASGTDGGGAGTTGTGGVGGTGGTTRTGGATSTGGSAGSGGTAVSGGASGTGGRRTGGTTSTGGVVGGTGGGGTGGAGGSTGIRVCGSVSGLPCLANEFCEYSADACGIMDAFGVCTKIPTVCPSLWAPVCGCDGKTYGNDCARQVASMSKAADGECGGNSDGGASAVLVINPKSASFITGIGITTSATVFTVQNAGSGASGSLDVSFTGTDRTVFEVSSNTCAAFLPGGQTCQVAVVFHAPRTSGNYSATLSIAEDGGSVLTAPLSGFATPTPGGGTADAAIDSGTL